MCGLKGTSNCGANCPLTRENRCPPIPTGLNPVQLHNLQVLMQGGSTQEDALFHVTEYEDFGNSRYGQPKTQPATQATA